MNVNNFNVKGNHLNLVLDMDETLLHCEEARQDLTYDFYI